MKHAMILTSALLFSPVALSAPFSIPQPIPYFSAVSPIFGYDPAYGSLLGIAWFSYPTGEVPEAMTHTQLNVIARLGLHGSASFSQQRPKQWGNVGWDYSFGLNNFFDYSTTGGSTLITEQSEQVTLATQQILRFPLTQQWQLFSGANANHKWVEDNNTEYQADVFTGVRLDSRNNPYNPSTGLFIENSVHVQPASFNNQVDALGLQWRADARLFASPFSNQVIALRLVAELANDAGLVSQAGGSELLRGYLGDQFNGSKLYSAQAEYRLPIWSFISGVAFTDSALIGDSSLAYYSSQGVGLRFGLPPDQSMSVRLDVARNQLGEFNSYVSFNQVF